MAASQRASTAGREDGGGQRGSGGARLFRWGASGAALVLGATLVATPVSAAVAILPASQDNTLIETTDGSLSNGAGPFVFAGRTSQEAGSVRRALLAFDVAQALPAGAVVTRVALALEASQDNGGASTLRLHRVLADWGEGASWYDGGRGAPALPDDATWIHRFFDEYVWSDAGGDFSPVASASTVVEAPGVYVWSSPQMAADVQVWLDDPARDFGWILLGDEASPATVKRFDSRESPLPPARPALRVEFRRGASAPCRDAGFRGRALGLCRAYCEALECDGAARRAPLATCARLDGLFRELTDGAVLPCAKGAGPSCPCFGVTEVAGLILALEDETTYTDLTCIDTRIDAKPLTAVRAVRLDGADCSTESADCSALAFEFTEDNICQLNLPAPEPSVDIQGITDFERFLCRQAIRQAAEGLGLPCN